MNSMLSEVPRIRFSIIIPTFRRKDSLRACLDGLAHLDYPRAEFETIVVDDGSLDPPSAVVRLYEELLIVRLVLVTPNAGPAIPPM